MRQFAPGVGGMEEFVRLLALRQRAAGMVVRIVTLDRIFDEPAAERLPARDRIGRLPVTRLRWWGSKRYPIALGVLRALDGADLVHVHGVDFFCDFLAATQPLHRRRMVLSTHGGFFHTRFASRAKRLFFALVTRWSLRRYAAVIPSSLADEAQFRAIRSAGLETVENGVDLAKFDGCADPAARAMLYFGRLAPNKGLERLIAWFALVHRRDPRWRLIVAGREMGVQAAALRVRARAEGVGEAVEVHAWPSDAELRALIGRSSVYVCASDYEGFGLAAVEGMAAGLYPLLRDIPAFRRTLARTGYGTLCDFDPDPAAVAETLDRVLAALAAPLGPAERQRRLAPFGWEGAATAIGQIYLRALGRSRRRIGRVSIHVSCAHGFQRLVDRTLADPARPPLFVAFCNAHTANTAERDPAFAAAIARAVVVNDGAGVDLASTLLFGAPFQENLNGTDLMDRLFEQTEQSLRVFLLGSPPGVAEQAARRLHARFPRHRVVGTAHGFFAEAEVPALLARIRASGADLILVGMGHPRQEIWCAAHYRALGGITIAVGAYLDFLAGEVPRAPRWVRRLRGEWLYRLAQEPRRLWRRYMIGNVVFLGRLFAQWFGGARI
ncbi:WecB/TagA/CpsF family glycosyltransferase [Sphingomonas sp. ac-8]|uniref:WecB/TagA/CpsF family glycosyltransferase n=1 Tax=Sphingomonas sp. ac-8 TaxID=3242977 RepID=UPI003A806166